MMDTTDIKRLNYIKYTASRLTVRDTHCLLVCLLLYLARVIYYVCVGRFGTRKLKEIFIVAASINNKKSLQPILDHLPQDKCITWGNFANDVPYAQSYMLSLIYLPLFLKFYYQSSKEDKKLIRFFYMEFISTPGMYIVLNSTLRKNKQLKMILFANDHSIVNRCLIELAEKYKIKTLYVQHASVTNAFPPLRFDYSFLDGLESYEKYQEIGDMRGLAFLTGSPRFDAFHNYRGAGKKYDIGLALNQIDSPQKALDLCLFLKNHNINNIVVRPHPGMLNGLFDDSMFKKHGIAISNPKEELSFVFLSYINVLIANESGIHLDAALMNVQSMLYNFTEKDVVDWYSFLKKGLIKECSTPVEVLNKYKEVRSIPTDVVRYYAASYKSPVDGKVGEMIANFICYTIFNSEEKGMEYLNTIMMKAHNYYEYRY